MASNSEFKPSSMSNNEQWHRVDELLQSALEHEPGRRAAFLREVCAGDDLLLREVESLLLSHERAGDFLEGSVIVDPERLSSKGAMSSASRHVGPDELLSLQGSDWMEEVSPETLRQYVPSQHLEGRTIGPYRIGSMVGRGGMGEVYQARDTRLDRVVALKILPAEVAGDAHRMKRFRVEAKAASALNHPSVATIYDVGEEGGINFIAMEYVEGQTLGEKIDGRPTSVIEIRTIARQVAEALEAAHSKGITHRDIKPANLMITIHGDAKVLDFGLAKMTRQAVVDDVSAEIPTLPGVLMGTVEYMSPEQALSHEVDHRTDIFSLGVVLTRWPPVDRRFVRTASVKPSTMSCMRNPNPFPA